MQVLESEINQKFEDLFQQKLNLEQENQELVAQLSHLENKFKDCEMLVEEEIKNVCDVMCFVLLLEITTRFI